MPHSRLHLILTLGVLRISCFLLSLTMRYVKPTRQRTYELKPQMSAGTQQNVCLWLCVWERLWEGQCSRGVPLFFLLLLNHTITPHCPKALSRCFWERRKEREMAHISVCEGMCDKAHLFYGRVSMGLAFLLLLAPKRVENDTLWFHSFSL